MKERIDMLIEERKIPGFEFDNDAGKYAWFVARTDTEILAKHIVEPEDDTELLVDYYVVPYVDEAQCNELYDMIVAEFVDCYAIDLFYGAAEDTMLFDDVAGTADRGLMNILACFDRTYSTFLMDVIFWFGQIITDDLDEECDDECDECDDEFYDDFDDDADDLDDDADDLDTNYGEVMEVLSKHGSGSLWIERECDGLYWEFATVDGDIWYRYEECRKLDDGTYANPHYMDFGVLPIECADDIMDLRDDIIASFRSTKDSEVKNVYVYGDALEIFGIDSSALYGD